MKSAVHDFLQSKAVIISFVTAVTAVTVLWPKYLCVWHFEKVEEKKSLPPVSHYLNENIRARVSLAVMDSAEHPVRECAA